MHAELVAFGKQACNERGLHQRFPAGQGHTATGRREYSSVATDALEQVVNRREGTVAHLPGVWVVTVLAAQQTAGQKVGQPGARSVDRRDQLPGVHARHRAVADCFQLLVVQVGRRGSTGCRAGEIQLVQVFCGRGPGNGCCAHRPADGIRFRRTVGDPFHRTQTVRSKIDRGTHG